jgi:hypothetical protein
MLHTPHRRLIALNLALLAVLLLVSFSPRVVAQPSTRARGTYTMVSGRVQGFTTSGVYMLDSTNQEVLALGWDRTRDRLYVVGYRSLTADAKHQRGTR